MDFGRLPSLAGVFWPLPADAPDTARVLATAPSAGASPIVLIGAPTFANKPWLGTYYPAAMRESEALRYYAQVFPTLELNSTHYGLPDARTVTRWRQLTPATFQFCPKVPQPITHDLALSPVADSMVRDFFAWLELLPDRLGLPFAQLPPTFGPDQMPALERFLLLCKEIAPQQSLALELRHPLWFASPLASSEVFALLEALGVTAVLSDVAGRRDVLHQRLTTHTAFIRFNGHGLDATDYQRIDEWAERLADWLRAGLRAVYFFIHQKDINHTPVLARYLLEELNARMGWHLPVPKPLPQPTQGSLF